jgi:hypothetical protein
VFDAAARAGDFVGAHAGVADEDHLVVRAVGVDDVPSRQLFAVAAPVVLPQTFVDAVVEVEVLEVLELAAAAENSSSQTRMWSSIEPPMSRKSSTLTALWRSGAGAGRASRRCARCRRWCRRGRVRSAAPLAGKAAQAAQGDLDVARAEIDAVVEIAEFALFPDLDRRAVAADSPPMRMPSGCVAAVAEGRGAAGADPFAAAGVAFLLLGQTLFELLHQLVPAEFFQLGAFGVGEVLASPPGRSHSSGISTSKPGRASMPLKYSPKARSKLVESVSSLTRMARERT